MATSYFSASGFLRRLYGGVERSHSFPMAFVECSASFSSSGVNLAVRWAF